MMKYLQSKKQIFTRCMVEKVIYYVTLIQQLRTKAYNSCSLIEVTQVAFVALSRKCSSVACSIFCTFHKENYFILRTLS